MQALATRAAELIGRFGSHINFLQPDATFRQLTNHVLVHIFDIGHRKITTPHPGLVSHEKQRKARLLHGLQGGDRSRIKRDLFRQMKIISIFDQGAITVEEHSTNHPSVVTGELPNEKQKRVCLQ